MPILRPRAQADALAVIALIFGIFPVIPIAGSVAAIICGAVSRSRAKNVGYLPSLVASWGFWLGIIWGAITVVALLAIL